VILEVATLNIIEGKGPEFEKSFSEAQLIISSIQGYISHQLQKCIEVENRYILLVYWDSVESHTINFRESEIYSQWKALLHHYYDPFPIVEHYESVAGVST